MLVLGLLFFPILEASYYSRLTAVYDTIYYIRFG
jgi:hypothetical protein